VTKVQTIFAHVIPGFLMLLSVAGAFAAADRWQWMVANQMESGAFFGVSVAQGFSETESARLIFRQFRRTTWAIAGIAALLLLLLYHFAIASHHVAMVPAAAALLVLLFRKAMRVAYGRASRETKGFAIRPRPKESSRGTCFSGDRSSVQPKEVSARKASEL